MTRHDELVRVVDLVKEFPTRRGVVRAVDGVSISIERGQTMGLVGESGSGKSTLARAMLRLTDPTYGSVYFDGADVLALSRREVRRLRREMQIVFQDPYSSLNPYMTAVSAVGEPLRIHKAGTRASIDERARELLEQVGLTPSEGDRRPAELSGGQRQRVAIARALALGPSFLVCDEPVSALDVSIQSGILDLLRDLQAEHGLTYLFVSHDLGVVREMADAVAVMYLGRIVEVGSTDQIFDRPQHPYTIALLSAAPGIDPSVERSRQALVLRGDPPSPLNPPTGCRFRTRCWRECAVSEIDPSWSRLEGDHGVACHVPQQSLSYGGESLD